jgi:hypothetical protein
LGAAIFFVFWLLLKFFLALQGFNLLLLCEINMLLDSFL